MKKNILLITTDQQRYDTIGAGGFGFVKTPNLDGLAADGKLFHNAYTPIPACVPARHSILTGLYSNAHGFDQNYFDNERSLPFDIPTVPRILSDHDYDTVAVGKMHFSPTRSHHGFHRLFLMEEIPRFIQDDEYAQYLRQKGFGEIQSLHGVRHHLYMRPQTSLVPENLHGSAWVAEKTREIIREKRGGRPFFIWSSFIAPHPPLNVPFEWSHLYDEIPLPQPYESITDISAQAKQNKAIAEYGDPLLLNRFKQLYYCAVTHADHQVGKIIGELKEQGCYDDTLIIFTSDHGEMLGDNSTFQKFLPYDASAKVPCIVKPPVGLDLEVETSQCVDLTDLLPTFLDVAHADYPANSCYELAGESLFKKGKKDRTTQFVEYGSDAHRWISLRRGQYKYNYYYSQGAEELFDLKNDPKEQINLLVTGVKDYITDLREQMRSQLIDYESRWGHSDSLEGRDFRICDPIPIEGVVERNFPMFVKNLPSHDRQVFLSLQEEVARALRHEDPQAIEGIAKELDSDEY